MATLIKVKGSGQGGYEFPNGMKWEWCTFNNGTPDRAFKNIFYSNGIWMAGNEGTAGIYRSIDGKTWTSCNGTDGFKINTLYGANGLWVASGDDPWYSTDNGVTWGTCTGVPYFSAFLYNANGIWVGAGSNGIVYSSDGKSWLASDVKSGTINNIYFANGIFIASMSGDLRWSTDCKTWASCTTNTQGDYWHAVENHNGIWVALNGSRGAYYSTDGKTWTQSNYTSGYCYQLVYGNGTWAFSNTANQSIKGIWYSADGKNWAQSDFPAECYCVHYYNDLWIGATSLGSAVYYSYDAKHWVKCDTTGGYITQICSANGVSVARLSQSGLVYSPTWEPTIPAGEYLLSATPEQPKASMTENIPFTANDTTYTKLTTEE